MIKIKEGFKGERFASLPDDILQEYSHNPLIRNLYIRKIGFFPHVKYHYVQKEKGCDYGMLIYFLQMFLIHLVPTIPIRGQSTGFISREP